MGTVAMNALMSFIYFLLLWASVFATKYSNKVHHWDNPEPESSLTYPSLNDKDAWSQQRPGQNNTAGLIAGRAEFYWIVCILLEKLKVRGKFPTRSIGNLITSTHVLTTCRAIVTIQKPKTKWRVKWNIVQHKPDDIRVLFSTVFLWEKNLVKLRNGSYVPEHSGRTSGARRVVFVLPHYDCSEENVVHDLGIIVLRTGIIPSGLRVGNMPSLKKNIESFRLSSLTKHRWVCYVASFGFIHDNVNDHAARDYKVKYRAYYTPWERCSEKMNYICWRQYPGCGELDSVDRDQLRIDCFSTRAKIGAVCDSDKGAPLVCNGQVVGMVLRAALFDSETGYCNNLLPLPFIVLGMSSIKSYLLELKKEHILPNARDYSTRLHLRHILMFPVIFIQVYA